MAKVTASFSVDEELYLKIKSKKSQTRSSKINALLWANLDYILDDEAPAPAPGVLKLQALPEDQLKALVLRIVQEAGIAPAPGAEAGVPVEVQAAAEPQVQGEPGGSSDPVRSADDVEVQEALSMIIGRRR